MRLLYVFVFACLPCLASGSVSRIWAVDPGSGLHAQSGQDNPPDFQRLPEATWNSIERSVDRGIVFLLSRQNRDGSFGRTDIQRSGITALVGMSLISRGHVPSDQPGATAESKAILGAVDYVLSVRRPNGLLSRRQSDYSHQVLDKSAMYNHGICGMFLCEVYGMVGNRRAAEIEKAIPLALNYMRQIQQRPLPLAQEAIARGGWRYDPAAMEDGVYSDLSVTAWQVMFMRSAENAGFEVPVEWAQKAMDYVDRCYVRSRGAFSYVPSNPAMITRAMVGAGVICMFLTGNERPEMEKACGNWLVQHPLNAYNQPRQYEHYHYSVYYVSQAASQLGGGIWETVYPTLSKTLLENQGGNGAWSPESRRPELGDEYTTALCVLALTPPYQLLPIYQR